MRRAAPCEALAGGGTRNCSSPPVARNRPTKRRTPHASRLFPYRSEPHASLLVPYASRGRARFPPLPRLRQFIGLTSLVSTKPRPHPGLEPVERHMHVFIETQKEWMRNVPPFRPGDTLRVNVRVKEGEKERIQAFEGVCIARRGSGVSETFTVRKISNGVGVERIFPVHSPMLAEINVVRRGRVRRAKLYYLRNLTGKATRIKEKKVRVAVPESGTPE